MAAASPDGATDPVSPDTSSSLLPSGAQSEACGSSIGCAASHEGQEGNPTKSAQVCGRPTTDDKERERGRPTTDDKEGEGEHEVASQTTRGGVPATADAADELLPPAVVGCDDIVLLAVAKGQAQSCTERPTLTSGDGGPSVIRGEGPEGPDRPDQGPADSLYLLSTAATAAGATADFVELVDISDDLSILPALSSGDAIAAAAAPWTPAPALGCIRACSARATAARPAK